MTIIDLGAGNDPHREADIALDIRRYSATDIQADVTKLPLQDESVCKFYASQLLEHLTGDELAALFEEVSRVLEPDGEFQFNVPIGRAYEADPTHQTRWQFKTIIYYLPRDEVARLGWDPETFPDYYTDYDINLCVANRDTIAWLDMHSLPGRVVSFAIRHLSKYVTTDKWAEIPCASGNIIFSLKK